MLSGFQLAKLPSIYNNKSVLNEYITDNRLASLIQYNIGIQFSADNFHRKTHGFVCEQSHHETMMSKYNKKEGCFKIKLENNKHGWGRVKAQDHATLSVMHRPTRHSLCQGTYIDIDIHSCCQSIYLNIIRNNGIENEFPRLKEYVENRNDLLVHYQSKYGCNRDTIKNLFTMIGFGGSANKWFRTKNIENDNDVFIAELNAEYYNLSRIIYDANPQIINDILKAEPNRFIHKSSPAELLNSKMRTTIAIFYQSCERYCQEAVISYLCSSKGFNLKDIVPCQDGFMILQELYYDTICDDCEKVIKNRFNFDLKFVVKEFDERFEIPKYITDKDKKELEKERQRLQKEQLRIQKENEKEQLRIDKKKEKFENEIEKNRLAQLKDELEELKTKGKKLTLTTEYGIDWNITEASLAKELKKVCFNDNIIFVGEGEKQEGYIFNGVYWKQLALHNAELFQNHFDNLYRHYIDILTKIEEESPNDEYLQNACSTRRNKINILNSYKTRVNIIKIFKTDNHKFNVVWNKNINLFIFENAVYDLENDNFVDANPDEYMNSSCGYEFNLEYFKDENVKNEINKIRVDITKFIKSIVAEVNYEYMMKYMSSFLKQENKEELAHFMLGSGRNGKGTLTSLAQNTLGKYWGELSMDYYTKYAASPDAPNQNLYNCRNARALNSSEISDRTSDNKPVFFIEDKFKNITGSDPIYARELGTKNTAYFYAGKILIQTNKMPNFSKTGKSLLDRIRVIDFPYTFVNDTDPLLKENPSKYKLRDNSLKDKFKTPLYKSAMIIELFDWYKKYKIEFKITDNIRIHTDSYFATASLEPFIMKNLLYDETKRIPLTIIQKMYEAHSDKKLSIKQIKEELIEKKFQVKTIKGYMYLANYYLEETEETEETYK